MAKKKSATKKATAEKAKEIEAKVKAERIDKTGLTSRVRGHVSARGKRSQKKRDSR